MPYASLTRDLPFAAGSETSRDAALEAAQFVGRQGLAVLAWFQGCGVQGGTQKEASAALNIGRPSICARVRALEQQGQLWKTTDRRRGCAVYRAMEA